MILLKERSEDLGSVFTEAVQLALEGGRLSLEQAASLLDASEGEIPILFSAADALRRRQVGDTVTFVVNRNINFTNICTCGCSFCAFSKRPGDPGGYLLSMDQVRRKVVEARKAGATEVCIQGGINPSIGLDYYLDLLAAIRDEMPGVHVHGFSPMEIESVAKKEGLSPEEVLQILREAGLGSMPGTAAEILVDEVRRVICPRKLSSDRWEEIVKTAHRLGIPSTATIMYGTVETVEQRAAHLLRIRRIQEETGGFTEFIPLPFIDPHRRGHVKGATSGVEDLKMIAASRLVLGRVVPNIQVSWVKMGVKLAQVGLVCGANDLGGTLMEENISHSAGATTPTSLRPEEMVGLIRGLDRRAAQRDTLYRILKTFPGKS